MSSYSNPNGSCVQVSAWRTSSRSAGNGACIEAGTGAGIIGVRDSKQHGNGPVLEFTPCAWTVFLARVRELVQD